MTKPADFFRWEQGRQRVTVGKGICYGLCIKVGKQFPNSSQGCQGLYNGVVKQLANKTQRTLQSSSSSQKGEDQSSRPYVNPPNLPQHQPIIIFCNISVGGGFCTRYSIASYFYPFSYMADHACLLWHGADGTVVFDPNSGVSIWPNITNPGYQSVQTMLDYGYRKVGFDRPVYVTSFQKVFRG